MWHIKDFSWLILSVLQNICARAIHKLGDFELFEIFTANSLFLCRESGWKQQHWVIGRTVGKPTSSEHTVPYPTWVNRKGNLTLWGIYGPKKAYLVTHTKVVILYLLFRSRRLGFAPKKWCLGGYGTLCLWVLSSSLLSPFGRPSSWKVGSSVGRGGGRGWNMELKEFQSWKRRRRRPRRLRRLHGGSPLNKVLAHSGNRAKRGEWGRRRHRCPRCLLTHHRVKAERARPAREIEFLSVPLYHWIHNK